LLAAGAIVLVSLRAPARLLLRGLADVLRPSERLGPQLLRLLLRQVQDLLDSGSQSRVAGLGLAGQLLRGLQLNLQLLDPALQRAHLPGGGPPVGGVAGNALVDLSALVTA
jgi:hypothetical protein